MQHRRAWSRVSISMLLGLVACREPTSKAAEPDAPEAPAAAEAGSLPDFDPALAHRLVEQDGALLLDVRTPDEFSAGHIDGAHNIAHTELSDRIAEIERLVGGDKTKPIVVYCRSGRRAGIAKEVLTERGFSQVTNLGGMSAW